MASRVTKDKAFSFDSSTLLTVVVGEEPDQKRFSLHEGIICARSEFFRRAMNGNWLEKEERIIRLPEDDPAIFAIYINVAYMDVVPTNATNDAKPPAALSNEIHELCTLYVLCEKLRDRVGKNTVLRAIMAVGKEAASDGKIYSPRADAVTTMYAGTLADSPGRKLFVQMWFTVRHSYFLRNHHNLPRDFPVDYSAALLEARSVPEKSWKDHESSFLEELA